MKHLINYLFLALLLAYAPSTYLRAEIAGGTPPFCGSVTVSSTTQTNTTPVAIPNGPAVVSSTITISGITGTIGYMSLITNITHTFAADLDVTLQSPAGTVVTLTTDNGGGNDNVFNGTVWSNFGSLVTDFAYANNVTASPLMPEESFGAFVGEDPNGTWTLTISDDLAGDGGSLDSWSLGITAYGNFVFAPSATFSNTTSTPVVDSGTASSTIVVSGLTGTILDVNALTNITHTFPADLDVTIQSPAGTIVTLTTDNGGSNDNVFNGTVWDDDANPSGQVPYTTNNGMVTDHAYADLTLASPLVPEGSLAAFIGEDPNGTWTITVVDDAAADGGAFTWALDIVTCTAATPASNNYVADDPTTLDCLVFNYFDISTTGTLVTIGDDVSVVQMLDAPMPFYDDVYTSIAVSTNGYLTTDLATVAGDLANDCPLPALPSTGGGSRIYSLHDDLVCEAPGGTFYQFFSSSPVPHPDGTDHSAHIFQWVGWHFGETDGVITLDFEAIVYDNGDIIYQYNDVSENGSGATVGMQHESLANATTYSCNTPNSINPGDVVGFSYGTSLVCAPPPNDLCDAAIDVALDCGETVAVDGTTISATPDGLASDCNDGSPTDGNGVWYSVVGTGNTIIASLCGGAAFDTEISVYTGTCGVATLSCVAGNDDFCSFQSETSWASAVGTTYYILVHGFGEGDNGNFTLTLSDSGSEPNDECSSAENIDAVCGGVATISGSTLCATYNSNTDENCAISTDAGTGTVWYSVFGNGGNYTVSTCVSEGGSANYDTKISVFSGTCSNLNCIDGNDDTGGFLCSTVSWNTTSGELYYIMVHGFDGAEGNFTLALTASSPLSCNVTGSNISCFGANDGAASVTASGGGLPYDIQWSNGATTASISGLSPGTYGVTVTEGEGCTCIDDITITQPQVLSATTEVADQGNGGPLPYDYNTATVLVSGGTPPYSFDWDNSGYVRYDIEYTNSGAIITIIYADSATWGATISDSNECHSGAGAELVVGNDLSGTGNLLDITNYTITSQSNTQSPNGAIVITVGGGNCSGNYTYQWAGPNGFTATTQNISGLVSGWYSVTVTCGNQNAMGWYWLPKSRRGRTKVDSSMFEISPNPVSSIATISFALPYTDVVKIELFDMSGRLMANVYHGQLDANEVYEVPIEADILPQGAYLCRLIAQQNGEQLTQKIWLMK